MSSNSSLYDQVALKPALPSNAIAPKMYKGFSTINTSTENFGLYDIELIKQDLINHFNTKKGERLMNPEFGCDVWLVLFEQMDGATIESRIETSIVDAVDTWLPYLSLTSIVFDYDDNDIDTNKIALEIQFSLKSNSSVGSSVTIDIK